MEVVAIVILLLKLALCPPVLPEASKTAPIPKVEWEVIPYVFQANWFQPSDGLDIASGNGDLVAGFSSRSPL